MHSRPFVVALTGGVASGKSTIAARFSALGAEVTDADVVARRLVEPGSAALEEIAGAFGPNVFEPDGSLDRGAMRDIVFADTAQRHKLEAILHPRVRASLLEATRTCRGAYCLLVIPLLAELHASYGFVDRVLVVDARQATQLARLMSRDTVSADRARLVMAAQVSRERRLAIADDVVDNDGDARDLDSPLLRLHRVYSELASRALAATGVGARTGQAQ